MDAMNLAARAMGIDSPEPAKTWTTFGKVTAVSTETITATLGNGTAVTASKFCTCEVDDIVLLLVSGGRAAAIAVRGGSGGGGTTVIAGTGLDFDGDTLNHSNAVTAGTIGQSSATSGSTLAVPYATYDAQGHITGKGTHTHTVNSLSADVITQTGLLGWTGDSGGTIIPYLYNDLAHLYERGGSTVWTKDGTVLPGTYAMMFDGSPSYNGISTSGATTLQGIITFPQQYNYGNRIYVIFATASYAPGSLTIETHASGDSDDTWTERYTYTASGTKRIYHYVSVSLGATYIDKMRLTMGNLPATIRICEIGLINYGGQGLRTPYMSRGIDDGVFRNISPNTTGAYNLGTSSKHWGTVYANTLTGSLAATNLTGTIASARLPLATSSAVGAVKPDGSTITVDSAGVLSATGGGGVTITSGGVTHTHGQTGYSYTCYKFDAGLLIATFSQNYTAHTGSGYNNAYYFAQTFDMPSAYDASAPAFIEVPYVTAQAHASTGLPTVTIYGYSATAVNAWIFADAAAIPAGAVDFIAIGRWK